MNEKELLELKEQIEDAKQELNRQQGRLDGLKEQLLKDWSLKSIEQIKPKLKKLRQKMEEYDEKLTKGIAELEEKYEFE